MKSKDRGIATLGFIAASAALSLLYGSIGGGEPDAGIPQFTFKPPQMGQLNTTGPQVDADIVKSMAAIKPHMEGLRVPQSQAVKGHGQVDLEMIGFVSTDKTAPVEEKNTAAEPKPEAVPPAGLEGSGDSGQGDISAPSAGEE
ncbi:MAG: hypothetical protein HQL52_18745 [Magnetococcales bacterium]|nr:hypothetical protein [Magnetococcales bacterium]